MVQLLTAEILAVWGITSFVMAVWNTIKPETFGDMSLSGIGNWIWFLLGFALFAWSLWQIFVPKVKGEVWRAINIGSWKKNNYDFFSTHPSYVLVDLIMIVVYVFVLWYGWGIGVDIKNIYILLGISAIFPVLRLFAWYVLGLKIKNSETRNAWKPAAWVFIPTYLVFALIGVLGVKGEYDRKKEIANLPVINEQTFADGRGKFESLKDKSGQETGFVRLRATQISEAAMLCKNSQQIDFATVLADLGTGGDVLIVGAKYSHRGFDELLSKSTNNKDKTIEVIGKLRELPAQSQIESWKNYCGIENLPPKPGGGRWVLEIQEP